MYRYTVYKTCGVLVYESEHVTAELTTAVYNNNNIIIIL